MNNIGIRRIVAIAVLLSLIFWTIGCTSYQAVDDWREHPEESIRVKAKDRAVYVMKTWRVEENGSITGQGLVFYSPTWWSRSFQGTIPAESIAHVEAKRFNAELTAFAVGGTLGLAVLVGTVAGRSR